MHRCFVMNAEVKGPAQAKLGRATRGRLLVLAIWGGVSFILALRWFRWT
ncbi:MAG: hypothetical protein ABR920_00480 [Terriglobales bacterium]